MSITNIEIKAASDDQGKIRKTLRSLNADFRGIDHQTDTYFKVNHGRLKLREGEIENNLIWYERDNITGPKQANVILFRSDPGSSLKEILTKSCGILAIVDKKREIYFINNVKFHIDTVDGAGSFIEIEAIDEDGTIGRDKLMEQCNYYLRLFNIPDSDLVNCSYSDMLLKSSE